MLFEVRIGRRAACRWVAITVTAFHLCGCVGFGAVVRGSANVSIDEPVLRFSAADADPPRIDDVTVDDLRRAWGEPRHIFALPEGGRELVYRCGLHWRGVGLLLLVVPVPLMLPAGFHEAHVTTRNGRVVAVHGDVAASAARIGCIWGPLAPRDQPACGVLGKAPRVVEMRRRGAALAPRLAEPRPASD